MLVPAWVSGLESDISPSRSHEMGRQFSSGKKEDYWAKCESNLFSLYEGEGMFSTTYTCMGLDTSKWAGEIRCVCGRGGGIGGRTGK